MAHVRRSAPATERFRKLQVKHLVKKGAVPNADEVDEEAEEECEEDDTMEGVAVPGVSEQGRRQTRVLRLRTTVDTRWNSDYDMLQRCVHYREYNSLS